MVPSTVKIRRNRGALSVAPPIQRAAPKPSDSSPVSNHDGAAHSPARSSPSHNRTVQWYRVRAAAGPSYSIPNERAEGTFPESQTSARSGDNSSGADATRTWYAVCVARYPGAVPTQLNRGVPTSTPSGRSAYSVWRVPAVNGPPDVHPSSSSGSSGSSGIRRLLSSSTAPRRTVDSPALGFNQPDQNRPLIENDRLSQ